MLKNYGNSRGFLELHNVKNVSVERILTKYISFTKRCSLFVHFTLCSWFLKSTRKGQPPFIRQPRITSD